MILLIGFAFLGGIITVLSPCALPLLPILLSGTTNGGKARPWGIVTGFVGGFSAFTLGVTLLVQSFALPPDGLRWFAGAVVLLFGLVTTIPFLQQRFQALVGSLLARGTQPVSRPSSGFWGGLLIGLSLGLAWSPCVGPIMAAVLSLALSQTVTWATAALTVAYALGTALPLLAIMLGGRTLLGRVPWLGRNVEKLQRIFGFLMIVTGIAILVGWDRELQALILRAFPSYAAGLTSLEADPSVLQELEKLGP